jgi:hypothetical protein
MPYAHPTVEHFAPLFVTLGASTKLDEGPKTTIEGFWWGLSKRAFQVGGATVRSPHYDLAEMGHLARGQLDLVRLNLLGHSTIVLTSNTYGHVLEQRQQEMARGMDAVLGG